MRRAVPRHRRAARALPDLFRRAAVRRLDGQRWTTRAELATTHTTELRDEEPGLIGVGMTPAFGIGQRALLVCTPNGNVLWDSVALLDDARRSASTNWVASTRSRCRTRTSTARTSTSPTPSTPGCSSPAPTRSGSSVPSSRIELFDDTVEPVPGLTLARIGGHFDGAAVLHWPAGSDGRGALLTGDTITVVQDRAWVSSCGATPT